MKVLVTGGTGFLGSHLVDALHAAGAEVFALLRNPGKPGWLAGTGARFLQGDLFSIPPLPRDIDTVYHLAGTAKSVQTAVYYTVNHLGTASLLAALESRGVKAHFVFVSTISAGGPSPGGRLRREDDPPRPVSPYGQSKLLAEREVLKRRDVLPVTILRPGFIIGPRDRDFLELAKIVGWGVIPQLRGRRFHISGLYIKDAVRALVGLLRTPRRSGGIYNIAAPEPLDTLELGRIVAGCFGKRTLTIPVPLFAARWISGAAGLAARTAGRRPTVNPNLFQEMIRGDWGVDTRKAAEELSFVADTPFERAMGETLAWYVERGWLRRRLKSPARKSAT
jgi:nucleoside-diphosphate-sugar epimerase